jgi:hypothetical protein
VKKNDEWERDGSGRILFPDTRLDISRRAISDVVIWASVVIAVIWHFFWS